MTRSNDRLRDERDQDRAGPGGDVRPSGVRLRSPDIEQLDRLERADPCRSIVDIRKRYKPVIWARIQKANFPEDVAEDILQRVFLTMHERILAKNEVPRPPGRTLATITTNLICNHVRARKRQRAFLPYEEQEMEPAPPSRSCPELALEQTRRDEFVRWIFTLMSDDESRLLVMVHFLGLTCEEIAGELDEPAGTVRYRIFHARNHFRTLAELHKDKLGGEL
jgi:RNA polymerase sigma-70 factor (ECF subfamily)